MLCWHLLIKDTDYKWARPALVAHKIRAMQLQAGQPEKKGNKRGAAYAYNIKELPSCRHYVDHNVHTIHDPENHDRAPIALTQLCGVKAPLTTGGRSTAPKPELVYYEFRWGA